MKEAKPFAELYPDRIVSMIKIGPEEDPTIVIATERNIFQISPEGVVELVKLVEKDSRLP